MEIAKNETAAPRTGKVTVQAGTASKTITVRQFDEVSGYFNPINSDGTSETRASTEYNHSLAKWAMELAYSAYEPLVGDLAQFVPGVFMEDGIRPANDVLEDLGFTTQTYNYAKNDAVAHVIGHRQIYTSVNNQLTTEEGGNNSGNLGYFEDLSGTSSRFFDVDSQSDLRTNVFVGNIRSDLGANQEVLNSYNTDCMRTLVVVDIRGSVTWKDWFTDIGTQVGLGLGSFGDGMDMVLKSLYGTGNTASCTECHGAGCEKCMGYIGSHNIQNPIFLVTGHSLGAAVANLVANELNSRTDASNVYAYTFATPKTVQNAPGSNAQNIFNFLNNNDVVPLVPTNISKPHWSDNGWTRHGRDFHITIVSLDSAGVTCGRYSEVFRNTLNAGNADCTRTLVVVDIRGSVTKAALKLIMTYAALIYTQKQISH